MKCREYLAHVADDRRVHLLDEHLRGTASRAAKFAEEFGCGEWAYLAGLWHDIGKYAEGFQKKILASSDAHMETKSGIDNLTTPLTWEGLAKELNQHYSVLCIVNRRDDCRILYELMPKENTFHLSALMCGAHRSKVISQIKQRLKDKLPTRVISTQLVEAGVDFDFPIVYRTLAGLDSIAQAAGRCNREGLLNKGRVFVFAPPSEVPVGYLR